MNIIDFKNWMQHRNSKPQKGMPVSDRLFQVISVAGPLGITRIEIGREIRLDRHEIDKLLNAMVQMGQIFVAQKNGELIYRVPG